MSENGIGIRGYKKFKTTTNSNHKLPVAGKSIGVILCPDREFQYCSYDYHSSFKKIWFHLKYVSCKGNCWDNAPMELLWGKLKYEWIYGKHFKTSDQAKTTVF